jgi:hypothetical protein
MIPLGAPRPKPLLLIGSLGIAATPASLNFNLVSGGIATGSAPISVTTTVSGVGLLSTMVVNAYFASANALTDGAGNVIPSSAIYGRCSTCIPAAYTAFTQYSTFGANSSLTLLNSQSLLTLVGGSRTDSLQLQIDLSSLPQTPAGNYSGTLLLMAQVL